METIKIYLENMFMTLPRSSEVLRAKEELQNMMEDKYLELKKEEPRMKQWASSSRSLAT